MTLKFTSSSLKNPKRLIREIAGGYLKDLTLNLKNLHSKRFFWDKEFLRSEDKQPLQG